MSTFIGEDEESIDTTPFPDPDPTCKCLRHGPECTCLECDHSPVISDHVCVCPHHASDCKCAVCIRTPKTTGHICVCTSHGSICKCRICRLTPTLRTPSLASDPVCSCKSHASDCKCLACVRTPIASDYCVCASHGSDCKCSVCVRTPVVSDRVCVCADHDSTCKCFTCIRTPDIVSLQKLKLSARKKQILDTVTRTEDYLSKHRIPELIQFLLTKLLASGSDKPIAYLEKLLDDCMLYRAGYGLAPVLYEQRHLEAVMKSFDPGQRGWLSAGQMRRAYITLGLEPPEIQEDERASTEEFLRLLTQHQELELFELVSAGSNPEENSASTKSDSTSV